MSGFSSFLGVLVAERVVSVRLTAKMQQYVDGMNQAARATASVGSEGEKLAQTKRSFDQLGRVSLAAGGLIAAGLGVAVAKFAEFDQAMSNVQAATLESAENMERLRDAALDAGASTVFSASESANAVEELAKAGLSTADILGGGLSGALDLAAAGGLGVARAAEIASTTLQQFGLEGSDASHVADLLAAGAGKAMGDVEDMSQALAQSGLVANQFGLSIEETTATLSAFASAGLLGSDAGTSFRTMLLRLANPTGESADLMKELGIEAYDAAGQFIGMAGFAGELETALSGMTDEQKNTTLAVLFGQDAIRGANVLLNEGEQGIRDWTAAVDDQGYAAETAATRLDNFKGDVEALQGALDTAFISMGEAADGPLRFFTQALTGMVDKFNEMPEAGQQAVFWVGAVSSAAAIGVGGWALLVPKIAEYNQALEVLGPNAQNAARKLGAFARVGGSALVGVAAAATAADILTEALRNVGPSAEETANKIATAAEAADILDAAIQKQVGSGSNLTVANEQIRQLGDTLDAFKDGVNGQGGIIQANTLVNLTRLGEEFASLAESDLPSAQRQFRLLTTEGKLSAEQQLALLDAMPALKDALTEQATAAGVAADGQALLDFALGDSEQSTQANEDALRALAGQAVDTGQEVEGLADIIRGFGSATLDVRDAQRGFEQALDDVQQSLVDNGNTLDISERAGRDNQAAIDDLAKSTLEYAAALYTQTGSQDQAAAAIQNGRDRLIEIMQQFGLTEDEAKAYADQLGLIPENVNTYVQVNTSDAEQKISRFIAAYSNVTVPLRPDVSGIFPKSAHGGAIGKASGGSVVGPGSGTSDTAGLYRLSNGEHVLTAADVKAMGGQHAVYEFRDGLHSGAMYGARVEMNMNVLPEQGVPLQVQAVRAVRRIESRLIRG